LRKRRRSTGGEDARHTRILQKFTTFHRVLLRDAGLGAGVGLLVFTRKTAVRAMLAALRP